MQSENKEEQNKVLYSIKDIITFKNHRKWYQLCEHIPDVINDTNAKELLEIFVTNIGQYHPFSLVKATFCFIRFFPAEQAIEILNKSIQSIIDSNMYTGDFKMELMHLEIQKCIFCVETGNLEEIEQKIFEFKNIEMSSSIYKSYNYLVFLYYEKQQNYELCLEFLLEYIKIETQPTENSTGHLEKLAKYSLVSQNFFDFMKISVLQDFNLINEDILVIYRAVSKGDIKLTESYKDALEIIFKEKSNIVKEKALFIGLINLCFKQENKSASFCTIQEELGISDKEINKVLIKALGLGLIKGSIDGHNKVLHFNAIISRYLPKDELEKMNEKYEEWKNKVHRAIVLLK